MNRGAPSCFCSVLYDFVFVVVLVFVLLLFLMISSFSRVVLFLLLLLPLLSSSAPHLYNVVASSGGRSVGRRDALLSHARACARVFATSSKRKREMGRCDDVM